MNVMRSSPAARVGAPPAPLVAAAAWAVLVGVLQVVRPAGVDLSPCLFRNVTGLPCPACGSTRAVLAAAGGHLLEALAFNPLIIIAAALGAAWIVARPALGRRAGWAVPRRGRAVLWLLAAAAVAGNWAWVIARQG